MTGDRESLWAKRIATQRRRGAESSKTGSPPIKVVTKNLSLAFNHSAFNAYGCQRERLGRAGGLFPLFAAKRYAVYESRWQPNAQNAPWLKARLRFSDTTFIG